MGLSFFAVASQIIKRALIPVISCVNFDNKDGKGNCYFDRNIAEHFNPKLQTIINSSFDHNEIEGQNVSKLKTLFRQVM